MARIAADRPAMTSARNCGSASPLDVASKADPRELPACRRREEIAVAGPAVPARRGAAGAFQHELPAHELAVILADRALHGREAGVGKEARTGPFPHVAEDVAGRARHDGFGAVELVAEMGVGRRGEIFPLGF